MRKKKVNRKYKDRLFRLIFKRKEDLLELYNAVNGSHYDNPDDLEITTLDDAVYMGIKNDISFLISDILNLYEHQSTFNPNMPARGFLYLADVYRKIIDSRELDLYHSRLVNLPYPIYIVFYNGTKEMPERYEMKLSDSFSIKPDGVLTLEFMAVMININTGKNKALMEQCRKLKDYSIFVAEVRSRIKAGNLVREAVDAAIEFCIKNQVLAEVLIAHRAEVRDMFLYDYDHEKHIEMERKEWRKIGLEEGHEEGRKEGLNEGLRILITYCYDLGQSYDDVLNSVSVQYHLTSQEAEEAMKQNWPA